MESAESSSNVTHCLFRLAIVGGGREEGGARGKAGASGVGSRANNGAGVGFRGGPNKDMDFCSCGGGAVWAGVGRRGGVNADIVL